MFHICQIIATPFVRFFFPTKFIGKKHIPKGACIIASNHTSNVDAPLLAVHTWEKKYYLAKKEMVKNKFIGGIVKSWGAIPIDRAGNDVVAIKECLKKLKAGKKLVIFPEGTRQHNENMELGQVKQGTAMLAIKGKVPIVPMFIVNKPKFWRRNKVIIGEPFELSDFYGKRLGSEEMAMASKIVEEKLNELREYALNSLTKKG
ncbi:MAG: 1-acyl-sn-glycerol-3-phosphate acyltransferase [Clostridia bacterium]|nr:1-acyl-sn-glycerol-3-phosphate acyltransferase [Clostridia bacterium]MBQ8792315.1 1-acyl-sn-glycerol-3-phosphate acyltransferase [Clostridia bacterium]